MKYSAKNKAVAIIAISLIPSLMLAAGKADKYSIWNWVLDNLLFVAAGAVILGAFYSLLSLMNSILADKRKEVDPDFEHELMNNEPKESLFSKWYNKLSGIVPIQEESDLLLDHDYDGIKELDNSLPPWWLYMFYITILIAVGYVYFYHYSDLGVSQQEEYAMEMKEGNIQRAAFVKRQANNIDEENLVALEDEKSLLSGMNEFKSNCLACHGASGEGGVGPNLTDKYWIHGGSTPDIYKTIKYGVPEKGMIAWKNQMTPATMHKLASYIQTLQGTDPPNQKAKEGVLYEGIPDSTQVNI